MELQEQNIFSKPKTRFWKFALWFVGVIVVAGIGLWALGGYQWSKNIEAFEEWVESTKRAAEEFEAQKAADTYGGATPQETLRMYIEAVEKGDYKLASRYFVLGKQEEEFRSLTSSPPENVLNVNNLLKESLVSTGSFSADKKRFGIREPLYIEFVLYTSGVWKIVEI